MGQKYTNISDLYQQVKLNERDIIERKLTSQELEDRERIAKKLPMADFKKRYGKDAMAVKMAVATNMAKAKNETIEDDLGEKYNLYHSTFSGAMQHAYDYAKKKMGITVDPKEIDSKVATGPKKPTEGKTNKYRLKGKGGNLQIQVYNKGGSKPFELNMYKEEFTEESVQTWYESVDTRMKYQLDHGNDWWWKMNEVHDKMLEKLGLDEGCSIDDDETPKVRMTMKEFALRNAWGEIDEAAEYDGRPVKLNNPTRGDVKKYKVYVRNDKGFSHKLCISLHRLL